MLNNIFQSALSTIELALGDPVSNSEKIAGQIKKADKSNAKVAVFPELTMTGYTCGDLFLSSLLAENCLKALRNLLESTKECDVFAFVGMPVAVDGRLFNCAVAVFKGKVLGVIPKTNIPNYGEYYESRYFASAYDTNAEQVRILDYYVPFGTDLIFDCLNIDSLSLSAEICEDLWAPVSPSCHTAVNGATVICNLSASNDFAGKRDLRMSLIKAQSEKLKCNYLYVSSGYGESSTDLSFGGDKIVGELGSIIDTDEEDKDMLFCDIDTEKVSHMRKRTDTFKFKTSKCRHISFEFSKLPGQKYNKLQQNPFLNGSKYDTCNEIFHKQVMGLAKRVRSIGIKKMIVGVSGGVDSTLALLVCTEAAKELGFSTENVIGITMPSFGTTDKSLNNSNMLMQELKITFEKININEVVTENLKLIGHDFSPDVTLENTQARQRTMILFNYANRVGGIQVGTSDLSEIALGFSTYGGDQMAMYNVNSSVPKTVAREIINWYGEKSGNEKLKEILSNITKAVISPELIPLDKEGKQSQSTEEIVGSYELIDFILYYHIKFGYSKDKIGMMLGTAFEGKFTKEKTEKALTEYFNRFYKNQFKRSCMPDGVKATEISLSPRGDYRLPSDINLK